MPLSLGSEVIQQNGLSHASEPGQEHSPFGGLAFAPDNQAVKRFYLCFASLQRGRLES
ncbi:hypothetical protein SAMN04487913_11743 [Arthrobacter sp. ok362]|nr:hypothetical protein SAMN04487913_11743 [Arthrobacter sp. ok362]